MIGIGRSRWRSTTRPSARSSPGPGSSRTSRRRTTRRSTTVDAWAAKIPSLVWIQGDDVDRVRRRRSADHRRPAAARVLPAPPAVRRSVAAALARRAVQAVAASGGGGGLDGAGAGGSFGALRRGPARLGRPSASRGAHGPTNANTPSQIVRNDHSYRANEAMPQAIGIVHGRSVRAPQTISAIAIGNRTQPGIGTTGTGLGVATFASMNRIHRPTPRGR